jgi:hypothetical protein
MTAVDTSRVSDFWNFVIERETIRKKHAIGAPAPYTDDVRLRDYWFPNIRRTDGKLYQWWKQNIADLPEPLRIYATIACWLFAKTETLDRIKPILRAHGWDSHLVLATLGSRSSLINQNVAMGILPINLGGVCAVMESAEARAIEYQLGSDLGHNTSMLATVRGIGKQLAFEIALLLSEPAPYIYAGRSTVRGTSLLLGLELNPDSMYGRDAATSIVGRLMEEAGGAFGWQHADAQKALELFHTYADDAVPPRRYRWT